MSMNLDQNFSAHPKSVLVPNFHIGMTPQELLNGCLQVCEHPTKEHQCLADGLKTVAPRRYRIPHGYWSPRKFISVMLLTARNADLNIEHIDNLKKTGRIHGPEHLRLIEKQDVDAWAAGTIGLLLDGLAVAGGPTYFVAQDFAEAMSRAKMKDSLTPAEMHFACSAAVFVLPEAFSRNFFGVFVPWVAYSWSPAEQFPHNVWLSKLDKNIKGRLTTTIGFLTPGDTEFRNLFSKIDGIEPLEKILGDRETVVDEVPMGDVDIALRSKADRLVLQLILGMSSIPQMIDEPIIERPQKIKHGTVVRDDLWAPQYLGFKYKHPPKPTAGSGTHASPIMHRRNGHWTNQPHGPGRALRKQIWIDECWVCVPDEEKENAKRIP